MRKFCLLLCLSLLSSLLHAAAMPVVTFQPPLTESVATQEHHACSETPDTSTTKSCDLGGHLCCLGLGVSLRTELGGATYGTELLNAVLLTLVLQDYPNPQFKPPKRSLQS